MLNQPKTYIKAIYATVLAFLSTLGTAYSDQMLTGAEWITIATATILAAGGVYGLANRPTDVTDYPRSSDQSERDHMEYDRRHPPTRHTVHLPDK